MNRAILAGLLVGVVAFAVLAPVAAPAAPPASGRAPAAASAAAGTWQVGKPQRVLGPSGHIDSVYFTVPTAKGIQGFVSNKSAYAYLQRSDGRLVKERLILRAGAKGDNDQCGVHPVGAVWKRTKTHWITFYHAEKAAPADGGSCRWARKHTRWTIRRMETLDAGRTWIKREQVLTQDAALLTDGVGAWSYATDDAGSPRLVVKGSYMYLFYRAVNRESGTLQQLSIARAPLSGRGKGGTWSKWYDGAFTEPARGGRQSPILGMPGTARGITWNTRLNRYVSVRAWKHGIDMYVSEGRNLLEWSHYKQLIAFSGTTSAWGQPCGPEGLPLAIGYAGMVGTGGSSATTGSRFWLYYMNKPAGKCFTERYLVRRLVTMP